MKKSRTTMNAPARSTGRAAQLVEERCEFMPTSLPPAGHALNYFGGKQTPAARYWAGDVAGERGGGTAGARRARSPRSRGVPGSGLAADRAHYARVPTPRADQGARGHTRLLSRAVELLGGERVPSRGDKSRRGARSRLVRPHSHWPTGHPDLVAGRRRLRPRTREDPPRPHLRRPNRSPRSRRAVGVAA